MLVATFKDDLVTSIVDSNVSIPDSVSLPEKYRGAPPLELRVVNGEVKHISEYDMFFVDQYGVRHVVPGDGRVAIAGDWTDPLIRDDETGWRREDDAEILSKQKDKAKAKIDAEAERLRATIITPGEGQVATYLAQENEAKFIAANPNTEAPTPYIDALVGIIAPTKAGVVEVVLAMSTAWNNMNAAINAVRLQTKGLIDMAETKEDIDALVEGAPWPNLTP